MWKTIIKVLDGVGYVATVIVVLGSVVGIYLWLKGILPVLFRLGNGLAKRKIAIFAKGDHLVSLRNLLLDSSLFKEKNILEITATQDLGKAEDATLYLVFWHDWAKEINDILQKKTDKTSLIVYAPRNLGFIPEEQIGKLDEYRNIIVTNFRGRLLNDIVASMITTSYDK